ncbi:MAG: signal peptide peptidase SppA [Egibacteraceae bacterium]
MRLPGWSRPLRPPLVLAADLSRPVSDEPAASPLARLMAARHPSLRDLVDTLAEAADDDRVRALVARVDRPAETWAHAEELRGAVAAFRRSGKRAVAHAQSFGEAGDATLAYYVAAAFDEIHLQPTGDVGLVGLAAEVPFVAELLDKLDVEPQVDRRHEYKNAANLLTERGFTDAHREAVDRIVASHHEQLVAAIVAGRGVDGQQAAALIDRGPLAAADARTAGLVDRLAYRDQTVTDTKAAAGPGARLVTSQAYGSTRRRRRTLRPRRATTVALVHGHGGIQVGRSRRWPLGATMGADTVVLGFQQAIRDRRVRAVLFRVDSPGGSAVASDAIWRAVVRARQAGKPVVVSMGSVAGSGGYWVSLGADRIVAAPGTITGSIGVVAGKLVTSGLRQRLGVTADEAHRGANALMFSSNQRFTEAQWERMQGFLDRVYDDFVDRVAQGRDLTRERVHELARGRVWTGADAAERGLVDDLGGYPQALAAVRDLLGLDPAARLRLRVLPRQSLPERLGLRQPPPEEARALAAAAGAGLRLAGLREDGAARMPEWATRLG